VSFGARSDGVAAILAVVPFGGGDVPGSALLVPLPRSDGAETSTWEIGWHLHPEVWGRGFATEAGAAMAARAAAAGLDGVHAVVHTDNPASLAVCDRLGMTRLGSTTDWYGVDLVDHHLPLAAGVPAPRRPVVDLTDARATPAGAVPRRAG
jgi:RimJ/RimL family protein N-acetyltransferase